MWSHTKDLETVLLAVILISFFFIGLGYTAHYSAPLPGLRVSILHLLLVFLRKYAALSLLSFSGTQLLCSVRSQDLLMEAEALFDEWHFLTEPGLPGCQTETAGMRDFSKCSGMTDKLCQEIVSY